MSVLCNVGTCNTMIFAGEPNDPEAEVKRISHNEWHHSTQLDNVARARELLDDVELLLDDVETGEFLGGYVKSDLIMSSVMKIRRFCEDNM